MFQSHRNLSEPNALQRDSLSYVMRSSAFNKRLCEDTHSKFASFWPKRPVIIDTRNKLINEVM